MPSRFKIREAIGLRPRTGESQFSSSAASLPAQSLPSAPSATVPSPSGNVAFNDAVQQHHQKLNQSDKDAFNAAYHDINPDDLLSRVKDFDRTYNEKAISRRCSEPVTRFIRIIEQFMQGVAIGIQSNPEISSLVVGAVRVIIDLAVKFVTFFNRLTEMMVCLTEHLGHLNEYAKAANGSKLLRTTLASVYGDLLTFCSQVRSVFVDELGGERKWLSIKIFIRVQWEPFEAKFGAIDTSIRHHLQVLLHSVQALQINAIEQGNTEAESERQRVREMERLKERKAFLTWISKLDFKKDHDTVFSKRHPDTGLWLLRERKVLQWLNVHSSAVLWCHGKPGAGKSVLASILLEHVVTLHALDQKVAIAFAYIKYDFPDSQQPLNIVSAFIKQLCWKKDTIPQDLLTFLHNYDGNARIPTLDTVIDRFIHLVKTSFDQVFLVIDALDECEEHLRKQILEFIEHLTTLVPTAKVFVTSRRETDIVEGFQLLGTPAIEIAAHYVQADIKSFVVDRVKHLIETNKLKIRDPSLEGEIIERLTTQAEGMFLWVNLQLENLCKQRRDRDIREELSLLPQGLDATYDRILEQIDRQPKALRCLAQKALMWVLYATRPLGHEELIEAVAIEQTCATVDDLDSYSIEVILDSCSNLLVSNGYRIRPVHFSVQEYLTHSPRIGNDIVPGIQLLDYHNAHIQLAESCLSYRKHDFIDKGPCGTASELSGRISQHSLAVYSSHFFDIHIHRATPLTPELKKGLDVLLCSESRTVAAILQLRQCDKSSSDGPLSEVDFDSYSWPVNMSTLIYSTALFDLPYLQEENCTWKTLELPKYTLHQVSCNGSVEAIRQIVGLKKDVNEEDEHGYAPLYYAAKNRRTKTVRLLLEQGAEVNAQGGYYGTALQAAILSRSTEIIRILLDHGAEVNVQGGYYGTALQAAVHRRTTEKFRILLDHGAEVSAQGGEYGESTEIIQILLDHGADVNAQGGQNGTALQAAASSGSTEDIQILLDKGADVNAQGGEDGTALQAAARSGSTKKIQILLRNGADVNVRGGQHGTALQAAASFGSTENIQILFDNGAEVNVQGGEYGTALQAAAYQAATYQRSIGIIFPTPLENEAEVNAQGGEYGTASQAAANSRASKIIQVLLENGAEVNAQDVQDAQRGEFSLALRAAVFQATAHKLSTEIIQMLLDKGADANVQGGKYGTALHISVECGDSQTVKRLLESGAEVNTRGLHGKYRSLTPLALVRRGLALGRRPGRSEEVVQLLLDAGGVDLRTPEEVTADDEVSDSGSSEAEGV